MKRVYTVSPWAVAACISAAALAAPGEAGWIVLCVCIIGVCVGTVFVGRRRCNVRSIVIVLASITVTAAGLIRIDGYSRPPAIAVSPTGPVAMTGLVQNDLRPSAGDLQLITISLLRVSDRRGWTGSGRGRVRLLWRGDGTILVADRDLRVTPMRGDLVTALVSAEDIQSGVFWSDEETMSIKTDSAVSSALRRELRRAVESRFVRLSRRTSGLVMALLMGDRSSLDPEVSDTIRRAGGAHVIALSGMHLAILAVLVRRMAGLFLPRSPAVMVTLFVLTGYVWLTGWIPSLVRALVLTWVVFFRTLLGRRYPGYIYLAQAVVAIALLAPHLFGDLGFQYSVVALTGLFLLSPRISTHLQWMMPHAPAAYLGASLAAIIATAPLSALHFGVTYPGGVLFAGLLSLLVAAVMWTGLVFAATAAVPLVGTISLATLDLLAEIFYRVGAIGASIPPMILPGPSFYGASVFLAGMWAGVLLFRNRSRRVLTQRIHDYGESQFDF